MAAANSPQIIISAITHCMCPEWSWSYMSKLMVANGKYTYDEIDQADVISLSLFVSWFWIENGTFPFSWYCHWWLDNLRGRTGVFTPYPITITSSFTFNFIALKLGVNCFSRVLVMPTSIRLSIFFFIAVNLCHWILWLRNVVRGNPKSVFRCYLPGHIQEEIHINYKLPHNQCI